MSMGWDGGRRNSVEMVHFGRMSFASVVGLWRRRFGWVVVVQTCLEFGRLPRIPGAMDRPRSFRETAVGNEAVRAHRTARCRNWNSLLMSIDAMKRGVVKEVWVAVHDQISVGVHQTYDHWEAVQTELRSRQRQCLSHRLLVDTLGGERCSDWCQPLSR